MPLRRPEPEAPARSDQEARQAPLEADAPRTVEPEATGTIEKSAARSMDTGSRLTPAAQTAARPPVLASEAMRRDLAPATPGQQVGRLVIGCAGLVGLSVALLLGRARGLGIPVGGAFAALSVLGLAPLAYSARAAALVTVASTGLAVVTWNRHEHGASLEALVPMIGALLLATALLFRSWHRASLLARALVALGIALCAGWVWMSGALHRVLVLEGGWQTWLPALLVIPLAILLMLSLLAFMDSRATAGCAAWSGLVLAWYAAYTWSDLLALIWPKNATGAEGLQGAPEAAIALLSGPLFVVALAIGLAQLLAVMTATDAD